jgi:N,N'-diacetyllegionaminate synthase
MIRHVAAKGRPVLMSTGMSFLAEVDAAVRAVRDAGNDALALLHCVSCYPALPEDCNLRAIGALAAAFDLPVGWSDHTRGIEVALAAVARGACIVEKHITVDRSLPGPDHAASLEPAELRALRAAIDVVHAALGDGVKRPMERELPVRAVARRSLAAATDLPAGGLLTAASLVALRPASGISPALAEQVIGRRARRPLAAGQLLDWSDLE